MSDIFFTCSKWGAANTDKYRRIPESNYSKGFIALQLKTKIPALSERELYVQSFKAGIGLHGPTVFVYHGSSTSSPA